VTATAIAALLIILASWGLKAAGVLRKDAAPILIQIVLYLTLPALVFHIMATSDLESSLLLVPVVGMLTHVVLVAVAWAACRVGGASRRTTGAVIVACAVGNTGFFGVPLIAASGAHLSLPAAVMFDTFCTGVLTWTSTFWISARYGERDGSGPAPGPMWRNLLLPPTWAMAAGLIVNGLGIDLPEVVLRPLDILGAAVLPLVLVYAGLVIEWGGVRRAWRGVTAATVIRLGVSPLIGLGVALALGLDGDVLRTVVLMAAMPTAMMSLVIGGWYRLNTDVIAGAVVVTALLAPIVLPVIRAAL